MSQSVLDIMDQDAVAYSVATASNKSQENPPPCLKLIVDCWEYIFGYLSLRNVHAMGQTCERMHEIAEDYICERFPKLSLSLVKRNEYLFGVYPDWFPIQTDFCIKFAKIFYIDQRTRLDYFLDVKIFSSLKTLKFNNVTTTREIRYTKNLWKNIEKFQLNDCKIDDNIFEQVAIDCPNFQKLLCKK